MQKPNNFAVAMSMKKKKKMNKGGDCYADGGQVKSSPTPLPEKNLADKIMDMLPHAKAFGGEIAQEHKRSPLGAHVEALVDKCLENRGMKSMEHFSDGGDVPHKPVELDPMKVADFKKGFGFEEPENDPVKQAEANKPMMDKIRSKFGFADGGAVGSIEDRIMKKLNMAHGGEVGSDDIDEPWENNSQWKDTDQFSIDDEFEDMPKKKSLASSVLESVRKRNMGK